MNEKRLRALAPLLAALLKNRRVRGLAPLLLVLALVAVVAFVFWQRPAQPTPPSAAAGDYLFCSWNAENFFDDQNDKRTGPGDREFDPWLANNPNLLNLKLAKLTEALLKMNDGRGPDVLALCEVESVRAAELLRDALNKKLTDPALHYRHVLMKELTIGRHIAPAILSRLPVVADRTRVLGSRQRILQGVVRVNGHDLIVIASHWTSRVGRDGGKEETGSPANEKQRVNYAKTIYGAVKAMWLTNPGVDVLICGDFNDTPADLSVTKFLHATGDMQAVRNPGDELRLFNLFAGKDPAAGFGTHYYGGRWFIFDQLIVTPGMLDEQGWACVPESARVVNTLVRPGDRVGRPWRFGAPRDRAPRGYSDHFPVTVRLRVAMP